MSPISRQSLHTALDTVTRTRGEKDPDLLASVSFTHTLHLFCQLNSEIYSVLTQSRLRGGKLPARLEDLLHITGSTEEFLTSCQRDVENNPPASLFDRSIGDIEFLNTRARNCLLQDDIFYIGELVAHTEKDLKSISRFGVDCLRNVQDSLKCMGLTLGMNVGTWRRPEEKQIRSRFSKP